MVEVAQCGVEEVVPEVRQEEGEGSVLVVEVAEAVQDFREEAAAALPQEEEGHHEAFHEAVVKFFTFSYCVETLGVPGSGVLQ